jgi:thiosulfate dehydrogenase
MDITKILARSIKLIYVLLGLSIVTILLFLFPSITGLFTSENIKVDSETEQAKQTLDSAFTNLWTAPAEWRLSTKPNKAEILYGKELVAHTARYLGPNGSVRSISNGLNCQNCHLNAGSKPFGNNYFAVNSTYPKMRARSGKIEDKVKRINDCFERSLNGSGLAADSKEMKAMIAYIDYLGEDVPKKEKPRGTGLFKIKELNRALSKTNGEKIYLEKCQSCHGAEGQGVLTADGKEYTYPPLWGAHSYNDGAGLYRMSNFASYVKYNMPFGVSYENPQLTDEEAWDLAGYVNQMPRPSKDLSQDWPDISKKPFDHPFGPYKDPFPETQHKIGPYKPIKDWYKNNSK